MNTLAQVRVNVALLAVALAFSYLRIIDPIVAFFASLIAVLATFCFSYVANVRASRRRAAIESLAARRKDAEQRIKKIYTLSGEEREWWIDALVDFDEEHHDELIAYLHE